MKKMCFVTAARSEYGLLKWTMKEVAKSEIFIFQLVVTGAHLSAQQGHTMDSIIEDGFDIDEIVDIQLNTNSTEAIADTMGRFAQKFSHVFGKLSPDYVVVLGDRYELLPIVNTSFVMNIPIIHISGGDVTEGAIDDGIRNAITMLATYHFPGTEDSKKNIIRMRGSEKNVWNVGEPGLDAFRNEMLMSREELGTDLHLETTRKWVLFTYHAETRQSLEHNLNTVKTCIERLITIDDIHIVATYSNADYGGEKINNYLEGIAIENSSKITVVPSLGSKRYLSYMKQVAFVIGNSSSGIVEAPSLGIPVINIGDRQKGRYLCNNIIQTEAKPKSIQIAIDKAMSIEKTERDNYWGDGHTAKKIMEIFKKELL